MWSSNGIHEYLKKAEGNPCLFVTAMSKHTFKRPDGWGEIMAPTREPKP